MYNKEINSFCQATTFFLKWSLGEVAYKTFWNDWKEHDIPPLSMEMWLPYLWEIVSSYPDATAGSPKSKIGHGHGGDGISLLFPV